MKILAIETSCDDTGIAVLEVSKTGGFSVLSNIVASQIEIHKEYGGVYPTLAKREHQKNLIPAFEQALKEAGLLEENKKKNRPATFLPRGKKVIVEKILEREPELCKKLVLFIKKYEKPSASRRIDLIAVTNGPGLEPCLWVGVNFAKAISFAWDIPIVPVNHIESHILVNILGNPPSHEATARQVKFPAIALVVSGGHTQIILIKKIGSYKILGETRDDAAGECFDKAARILNLEYPGGPIIAKLAEKGEAGKITLPRPMINTKDYDFSFSGLKTAVLYAWQKIKKDPAFRSSEKAVQQQTIANMSAEIQQAIVDVLIKKTIKAAKDYNAKTIILGGGVSANHELKTQLFIKIKEDLPNTELLFPQVDHSTDNGLMTAITGFFHKKNTVDWESIQANGNLRIGQ